MRHKPDEVFAFIVSYKQAHDGNSPTLLEICEATGISSKSVARDRINSLIKQGQLKREAAASRGIEVVGGKWVYLPPFPREYGGE